MRLKTFATFLILMSATMANAVQTETEWVKFTSPEGRFSLLLPHQPKVEVVTDPKDEKLNHKRISVVEDGYAFIIEHYDNIGIADPEKYFDGARNGMLSVIHGVVVRESKISLESYPGREFELSFTASNGSIFHGLARMYAVGNAAYSISYIWRNEMDSTLAAKIGEKYFSSLKLTARKS